MQPFQGLKELIILVLKSHPQVNICVHLNNERSVRVISYVFSLHEYQILIGPVVREIFEDAPNVKTDNVEL